MSDGVTRHEDQEDDDDRQTATGLFFHAGEPTMSITPQPPPVAFGKDTTLHIKIGFLVMALTSGFFVLRWAWDLSSQIESVADTVHKIEVKLSAMDEGHLRRSLFEHWVRELAKDNPTIAVPDVPPR